MTSYDDVRLALRIGVPTLDPNEVTLAQLAELSKVAPPPTRALSWRRTALDPTRPSILRRILVGVTAAGAVSTVACAAGAVPGVHSPFRDHHAAAPTAHPTSSRTPSLEEPTVPQSSAGVDTHPEAQEKPSAHIRRGHGPSA